MSDNSTDEFDDVGAAFGLFQEFFAEDISNRIRKATEKKCKEIDGYETVTVEDWDGFMFITLLMKYTKRNSMKECWDKNDTTGVGAIRRCMKKEIYLQIWRNLYLCEDVVDLSVENIIKEMNEIERQGLVLTDEQMQQKRNAYEKAMNLDVARTKWLQEKIQERLYAIYREGPDKEDADIFNLDETMMPWLGWCIFKQDNKSNPYGLQSRVITDSKTRFVVAFDIYFGSSSEVSNNVSDIVQKLASRVQQQTGSLLDQLDQLVKYIEWPYKVMIFPNVVYLYILDICILNAHIMYKLMYGNEIGIREFLLLIIRGYERKIGRPLLSPFVKRSMPMELQQHMLISMKEVYPHKTQPRATCLHCGDRTSYQCKCGEVYCKECFAAHLAKKAIELQLDVAALDSYRAKIK